MHSEFNPSSSEPVHFYQIWILPREPGLKPGYEQRSFETAKSPDALRLVASRDGREGSLRIEQDAEIYLASLSSKKRIVHKLESGRYAWLQVLRGDVRVDGHKLHTSDGVAIGQQSSLAIEADGPAEIMLFDLP